MVDALVSSLRVSRIYLSEHGDEECAEEEHRADDDHDVVGIERRIDSAQVVTCDA